MNVNIYYTKVYKNETALRRGQNKPNSNPIKPNSQNAQMNINLTLTKDYRKKDAFTAQKIKPNFQNGKNECKLNFNKGLQKKRLFSNPKNKPKTNPILSAVGGFRKAKMNLKSLIRKSGHTPACTVGQLFDIVVLYKYHLPIINPFTPLLG